MKSTEPTADSTVGTKVIAHIRRAVHGLVDGTVIKKLGHAVAYYARGLWNRGGDDHIFLLSGGLSFSLIVCVIPFVLIIFSGLGILLGRPSIANEINSYIDKIIPYPELASSIRDIVFKRVEEFRLYKSLAGLVGMVGLFFASSGLFSSMRTILNAIFRIKPSESVLVSKLRDFGMVLSVLVYFLVSTAIIPSLEVIGNVAGELPFLPESVSSLLRSFAVDAATTFAILLGFSVIYYFVPSTKMSKKVAAVSAAATTVLWEIAKQVFGVYIGNAVTLERVYGAYIVIIGVVFWFYYSSLVFIIGAEIGQLYRERSITTRTAPPEDHGGG